MKSLIIFIITGLIAFSAAGQSEEGSKLSRHNERVKHYALKIKYGESRTQREHVKNTEEIGKHLDSVVTEHEAFKKKIPKRFRDDVEKHTHTLEKQLAEARKHYEAMTEELNKEKHNEMLVRHHANRIYASLEKAEKEEEIIKAKTER